MNLLRVGTDVIRVCLSCGPYCRSVRTVLRMWMDLYPDDFDSPPYHRALMTLIKFVEEEIPCGAMEEVGTRSKKLFLHFSTAVNEAEIGQKGV